VHRIRRRNHWGSAGHPLAVCICGLWALVFAAGVCGATGDSFGKDVYLSGFVSQGYLNTSDNDFLVPRSVNGTAEFFDAALIVSANPLDRLRVGMQLLARNFGDTGNDRVIVDWAYGDYRWRDVLGFRAGKVKMPYGLYNEGRDVDALRTAVFLPQSVYPEKLRDFVLAYQGAGAYGSLELGAVGELDYHGYGGTLSVPDPAQGFWSDLYSAQAKDFEAEVGRQVDRDQGLPEGTSAATFQEITSPNVSFPWIWGGGLIWNTPLSGLRVGSTFMNGRFHYRSTLRYSVEIPTTGELNYQVVPYNIDVDQTQNIDNFFTASLEYTLDDLQLAAEYHSSKVGADETDGWYAQANYRFTDLISLGTYYAVAYGDKNDRHGDALESGGLPRYYAWQKDLTASARLDLKSFWLLKVEYHFIDGVNLTEPRSLSELLAEPLERHWGMFTAKTTFLF